MGQLVMGGIGAVIGAYFGGPMGAQVGFMIGSMIGGLLFPPKHHYPALQDLRMQNSAYGQPINWAYGIIRVVGNVIWAGPPTQHDSGGGKGSSGPAQSNYTISFACGICEGPIQGIRRIWANGKLIYDISNPSDFKQVSGSNSMTTNFTVYLGDENQFPDPTIVQHEGVGNVPPFRGLAYVVFNELDLTPYGQAIPNLSFEIVAGTTQVFASAANVNITPTMAQSVAPEFFGPGTAYFGVQAGAFTNGYGGVFGYIYGEVAGSFSVTAVPYVADAYGIRRNGDARFWGGAFPVSTQNYDSDGGMLDTAGKWWIPSQTFPLFSIGVGAGSGGSNSNAGACKSGNWLAIGTYLAYSSNSLYIYNIGGQALIQCPLGSTHSFRPIGFTSGYMYAVGVNSSDATYGDWIVQFDLDGNFIARLVYMGSLTAAQGNFDVHADTAIYCQTSNGLQLWNGSQLVNVVAPALIAGQANISNFKYFNGMLFFASVVSNFNFYGLVPNFNQQETTVQYIVNDACARAGLTPAQYDASACTDTVRGYVVSNAPSARDAITQILQLFFVDVSDTDGVLKFVRRGAFPVVTIPYSDIGAANTLQDAAAVDPLKRTLLQEVDLPQQLALTTYSAANDYMTNTQTAFRTQTVSNYKANVKAAAVMTEGEALQCAQTILWAAWINAESFEFTTDLSYLYLEPCDVVNVVGKSGKVYTVKLTKCQHNGKGVLVWTATLEAPSIYPAAGAPPSVAPGLPSGFTPQRVGYAGGTALVVMDISPLRNADASSPGLYVGAGGYDSTWPGAEIEVSRDGSSYVNSVKAVANARIGYVTAPPGNFTGGNQPDELNSIRVLLYNPSQALSSVSYSDFLNNVSVAYVGGEIIGFRTATLQADGSYVLTGLLRGLIGTERFMPNHKLGEAFCFLDPTALQNVGVSMTDFGQKLYLLPSTLANTANDSTVPYTDIVGNGRLQPLAPGGLSAIQAGSGSSASVAIVWNRRARINGGWNDNTDVPLDETTEGYTVTAYDSGNNQLWQYSFSQSFTGGTQPNATWPATTLTTGMSGATFGSLSSGATVTISVQQHSDQGILGVAASTSLTKA